MILHFYLNYQTKYGQNIFMVSNDFQTKDGEKPDRIVLNYLNENYWDLVIDVSPEKGRFFSYYYLVEDEDGLIVADGERSRKISFNEKRGNNLTIIDKWVDAGDPRNIFYTKTLRGLSIRDSLSRQIRRSSYTHEFKVKAPGLGAGETVFLLGSTKPLHSWNKEKPVLLTPDGDWYVAKVRFEIFDWPAAYKYGIYNTREKRIAYFEEGENRMLRGWELQNGPTIFHDGYLNVPFSVVKGAGINVPLFSLRSKKSFGVGDFMDLKRFVNWCSQTGISLIQLLPVNDTSAHGDWKDSYPYSAISAFALHPLYINLEKVAGKKYANLVKKLGKKQKQLNALPQVDYEQVVQFKRAAMKELYELQKSEWRKDNAFKIFFEENKHWLVPYAGFCYLTGKYGTSDYRTWKRYAIYDEAEILKLTDPGQRHYHQLAVYYFEQFHLHLQLKEAAEYAHRRHVVLKGDLPIGIYRFSCDTWMNPSLYNLEEQAGAPPDDFAVAGQNWRFPTYNWEEMRKNKYRWWKSRFRQLEKYFDALRIDHILGFFRIWSIPVDSVEGIMGRFVPAQPVYFDEFIKNRIYFNFDRYCRPFINHTILKELFDAESKFVIREFLIPEKGDRYSLKERFDAQRKVAEYLEENDLLRFKEGLFQLISNVILFEEDGSDGTRFHFRINMQQTSSFRYLDDYTQSQLNWLYNNYFFERQNYFWKIRAMQKLSGLKHVTEMLVFGEDLGMVPACVPEVMKETGLLGIHVQRMPELPSEQFEDIKSAQYLSVVQPSTHDMSTLREWWQENKSVTGEYFKQVLGGKGDPPDECSSDIIRRIIEMHLQSPAMWSIFLLQDLLALDDELRVNNPSDERINIPAEPEHYWRYRMNVYLEDLIRRRKLNGEIKSLIDNSGRRDND